MASYARMIAVPPSATFGCFVDDVLVGIAGLVVSVKTKIRHSGLLVGVYLDPTHRSHGLARSLVAAAIAEARAVGVVALRLTVGTGNESAERLYRSLGFQVYGVERRAVRLGDIYLDATMMVLDLD